MVLKRRNSIFFCYVHDLFGHVVASLVSQLTSSVQCTPILSNTILYLQVVRPLKDLIDKQKESRKSAELAVEKCAKIQADKRNKEINAKKISFAKSKESESLITQLEGCRSKTVAEKELSKLDGKCKKAEEGVEKSDQEYITKLIEAERARLSLDSQITTSTDTMQKLEEVKIENMKNLFATYTELLYASIPKIDDSVRSLQGNVFEMNPDEDVQKLIETRGPERQPAEQIIFSCYEEDMSIPIENARRKYALENKLKKVMKALQGESRARKGLNKLNTAYSDNPSFTHAGGTQDVSSQVRHSDSVLDVLNASVYRIGSVLGKLGQYEAPYNPLAQYIEEKRDKMGVLSCVLRVPLHEVGQHHEENVENVSLADTSSLFTGMYDEYDDADDFDDVEGAYAEFSDDEVGAAAPSPSSSSQHHDYTSIDLCTADYEYVGQEHDELTIYPGDVITVVERHDDGWWTGELNGKRGLFPASYVHMS